MPKKTKKQFVQTYRNTSAEDFIGLLVHDVRGPLSGVISASKLMEVILREDGEVNREQLEELIKIIQQATGNMRTIMDAAIEYDRIQRHIPSKETQD